MNKDFLFSNLRDKQRIFLYEIIKNDRFMILEGWEGIAKSFLYFVS